MKRIDNAPCPTVTAAGLGNALHGQWALVREPPPGALMTSNSAVAPGAKPPYEVPKIAAIRRRKANGYTVISTFAAGGGSTTGYRMRGFKVLAAVELLERAAETYRANHPKTPVVVRDIREVKGAELLKVAGLERGELDVFDGSPPCEPFSSAGKRDTGWAGDQDLFFDYARLVEELAPRVFVAENVKGLNLGRSKGYFKRIHRRLRECGYRVEARLLDAQWLGVPQSRERLIFVGVREDLALDPAFPSPLPHRYTVRDALPHLFRPRRRGAGLALVHDPKGTGTRRREFVDQPAPTVTVGGSKKHHNVGANQHHYTIEEARVEHDTNGEFGVKGDVTDRPAPSVVSRPSSFTVDEPADGEIFDEVIVGNEAFEPKFGSPDRPTPTIMAGGARTSGEVRDSQTRRRRKLTIDELKALCSFPPDYKLAGSYSDQWERLGDAVPPMMMFHIAGAVEEILDKATA